MLLLLKAAEYRFVAYDLRVEYLVAVIAILFMVLGLWAGRKLSAKPVLVPTMPARAVARDSTCQLGISPREQEVLLLIAAGHSNQEIADKLFLSLNTIKKHTGSLFRKLEAERRTQAIEKARQLGLLS